MRYFAGIDGGGTNSRILVTDSKLNPLLKAVGGSTNPNSNSRQHVLETLEGLFAQLTNNGLNKEDCLGLCIGSAGLNSTSGCKNMKDLLRQTGFNCPITAVNDSVLALAASFPDKPGAVLICGTGSNAYGMFADGSMVRCGGWGHIFDDNGSGYWIGKEVIRRALFSQDGRGDKTILEEALQELYQVTDLAECIDRFYSGNPHNKTEIARLAPMAEKYALQNDPVCRQILIDAADGLSDLVSTVLKSMGGVCKDVVVNGGTIENNALLFGLFKEKLGRAHPEVSIEKIKKEPIWGAVYLAAKQNAERW